MPVAPGDIYITIRCYHHAYNNTYNYVCIDILSEASNILLIILTMTMHILRTICLFGYLYIGRKNSFFLIQTNAKYLSNLSI